MGAKMGTGQSCLTTQHLLRGGGGWTEACGQQKQSNNPGNNQHPPQYANYWAPLTRKRHIPPHSAQPRHTNYWALRTRKRHQREHRPQRPTERSDPTQHAKGRAGDCPGPRKRATTRRNVIQGGLTPPRPLTRPLLLKELGKFFSGPSATQKNFLAPSAQVRFRPKNLFSAFSASNNSGLLRGGGPPHSPPPTPTENSGTGKRMCIGLGTGVGVVDRGVVPMGGGWNGGTVG